MAGHGGKWLEVTGKGWICLKRTGICWIRPDIAGNGLAWQEMGENGWERLGMSGNVKKFRKIVRYGWKWLEMAEIAGYECKCLETAGIVLKWLEIDGNG